VLLVASSHDIGDNPQYRPLNPQTHPQRRPVLALVEGMTRYLPRYLPGLFDYSAGAEDQVGSADASDEAKRDAERAEAIAKGTRDLQAFLDLALAQAPTAVVQHPTRSELRDGAEPGRAQIAEVAANAGAGVMAFDPYLEAAIAKGASPYRDDIHINTAGQEALAAALFDALVQRGVLQPSASAADTAAR